MFLPIPSTGGKYEINSRGKLRNAETKQLLKLYKSGCYSLRVDGVRIFRAKSVLLGEVFKENPSYYLVPSLDYKYEITKGGTLRNAKTKRILKRTRKNLVAVQVGGKNKFIHIKNLLWEVFGFKVTIPNRKPIPVTLKKGAESFYFPAMGKAAEFLSKRVFLSKDRLRNKVFAPRKSEYEGWQIFYQKE